MMCCERSRRKIQKKPHFLVRGCVADILQSYYWKTAATQRAWQKIVRSNGKSNNYFTGKKEKQKRGSKKRKENAPPRSSEKKVTRDIGGYWPSGKAIQAGGGKLKRVGAAEDAIPPEKEGDSSQARMNG